MTDYHVLYPSDDSKWQGDPNLSITGTGFSVPRGLEAVFSFNGLIMNDKSVYDKYRVMNIDGLADPDIRDVREEKFSDDGEDAYDSYYGGRTIVMKVRVEAYQLDKLRDMEEALRTAFADMTERPLYFLTGDNEKDHYIKCKKSQPLTKDEDIESMGHRFFREWQITLRASDPRFYRVKQKQIHTTNILSPINAVNIGNFSSYPIIKLQGQLSNIEIKNDNSLRPFDSIKFKSSFSISVAQEVTIDIKNKKITNNLGQNLISQLDKTSGWLKLSSGNNLIYLQSITTTNPGVSGFTILWQDSWI